jgi:hypothetical protein
MTRVAPIVAALLVAWPAGLDAHRLDEYLQAARVGVSPSAIVIELSLTPGVAIAADILARLDLDGDGRIQPREAESYGRRVLADLNARLDDAPLALTLGRVDVPPPGELRAGVAAIHVELVGDLPGRASGRHVFELTNTHLAEQSVYMANALLPETDLVTILLQERDPRQQTFRLRYETRPAGAPVTWLFLTGACLAAHVGLRRIRPTTLSKKTAT